MYAILARGTQGDPPKWPKSGQNLLILMHGPGLSDNSQRLTIFSLGYGPMGYCQYVYTILGLGGH